MAFSQSGQRKFWIRTRSARCWKKAEPGYYRTLFMTAYVTGMRSGELFALKWSDIELKGIDAETGRESSRGRIFVRRSLSWARVEKDDGPVRPRFFPPKTKAGVRTLPIPMELAGALRRWKLQCPQSEHDLVFAMPDGQPMHRSTALRYGLWPALSRAGRSGSADRVPDRDFSSLPMLPPALPDCANAAPGPVASATQSRADLVRR